MSRKSAYLYICAAACLWGIISFFVTSLYALGFTPVQVVAVRALSAAFFLLVYSFLKNGRVPAVQLRDSRYFVGTGIVSIVFFNWCMFNAIRHTSVSVATILLYTAPAFVTVLSRILFREALTPPKLLALLLTLAGCAFVAGVFPEANGAVSLQGLLLGLGAGFFYALYSIFGKYALRRYDSLTVTTYTFIFAAVAVTPFSNLGEALPLLLQAKAWLHIAGLGFLSTMLAYVLYTKGLTVIETSRAAIVATLEPVVAAVMSFWVFQEKLQVWQYAGIAMVLGAVVLVQERANRRIDKLEQAPQQAS